MATVPIGTALRAVQRLFVEGSTANVPDGELLERFLSEGDEAAFTALIERHGPMVLGTCRATLRDPDAAEDAFQATFLVLICKARSIRGRGALASWLYQVAHRIALQAGTRAARRRAHERQVGRMRAEIAQGHEGADDWRPILHEEVARLSEKYRLPLLLCDLEGKTHAQAAIELNCGEATVRRRLASARELLRSRLVRRGVTLSVGGLAMAFGRTAVAAVPPAWIQTTLRAAESFGSRAAGIAIGEVVSTTAATLARRSLRTMLLCQMKTTAAAVVFLTALVGIAWGLGLPGQEKAGTESPRMSGRQASPDAGPVAARAEAPAESGEVISYQGRVLDPEGRPFAGAAVYLVTYGLKHPGNPPVRATTGADGRFRFGVRKTDFDATLEERPWSYATLVARAPGYAFGVANDDGTSKDLTLKLARDDAPIGGRIIDLEGRPVAGARLTVLDVRVPVDGSLDAWLKALEERGEFHNQEYPFLSIRLEAQPNPPIIPPVVTGRDGGFRIGGIGPERVVKVQIEGPTIETKRVQVRTRPGPVLRYSPYKNSSGVEPIIVYGESFEHVAAPTRPIEGVVRDADTGHPLRGIMVHGDQNLGGFDEHVECISDAHGRYRLAGLPQGREGSIVAIPPCDFHYYGSRKARLGVPADEALPYLRSKVRVETTQGTGAIPLDIRLKRGVWVTGRIIDQATRKPVAGQVQYYVFADNPQVNAYPGYRGARISTHFVGGDGTFRLVAFPGPGLLAARADEGQYIRAPGSSASRTRASMGIIAPIRPSFCPRTSTFSTRLTRPRGRPRWSMTSRSNRDAR